MTPWPGISDYQNSTRKVMIDSDESGDYGVGALESDTSRLSIHDSIGKSASSSCRFRWLFFCTK